MTPEREPAVTGESVQSLTDDRQDHEESGHCDREADAEDQRNCRWGIQPSPGTDVRGQQSSGDEGKERDEGEEATVTHGTIGSEAFLDATPGRRTGLVEFVEVARNRVVGRVGGSHVGIDVLADVPDELRTARVELAP